MVTRVRPVGLLLLALTFHEAGCTPGIDRGPPDDGEGIPDDRDPAASDQPRTAQRRDAAGPGAAVAPEPRGFDGERDAGGGAMDVSALADAALADAAAATDAAAEDAGAAVVVREQRAFDLSRLHEVAIDISADNWAKVTSGSKTRVPCDITFDGVRLPRSGIRRKGNYGSISMTKPALSIKFNEFVPGQKLDGLGRLLLNNAKQDSTFLREHLGYELYRMAGLPGPRTAHAMVTVNGRLYGLYVIREAVNKDFLEHAFGKINKGGNLYEGTVADFVTHPTHARLELKNEEEEMRKRDDIIALAALIRDTPSATFERAVSEKMRLDEFLTGFAIDAVSSHWDSYQYGINNYYVYDHPADGKFVYIPHGMDWLFAPANSYPEGNLDPRQDPFAPLSILKTALNLDRVGRLAVRIRGVPALDQKWRAEVGRVIREVWDVEKLQARIDQAATAIRSSGRAHPDIEKFRSRLPLLKDYVQKRKAFVESVTR
jgi:spore coat protein H